ncbi:hypothetical protein GCM10022419_045510 [Nonomuraea rosea]|uniref:Uncharacterized protein n=1 Tax=Nonomuraea rosea TaxID=638574 RepID=A0ABP6X114_9ACTN
MSIWNPVNWTDKIYEQHLSSNEIDNLGRALEDWADNHPLADRPLIYINQSESESVGLSPRDLAHAVQDESSPLHKPVLHIFAVGLSAYTGVGDPLEQVVETLSEDVRKWQDDHG